MLLIDSNVIAKRNKPVKREVVQWMKADTDKLTEDLDKFAVDFTIQFSDETPINQLWATFKNTIQVLIDKHVPKRTTSTRYSRPWVNQNSRKKGKFTKRKRHLKKLRN